MQWGNQGLDLPLSMVPQLTLKRLLELPLDVQFHNAAGHELLTGAP